MPNSKFFAPGIIFIFIGFLLLGASLLYFKPSFLGLTEKYNLAATTSFASAAIKNVGEFGAVGDGRTDDSRAIAAAIVSGGTVQFGPKTYCVNSNVALVSNLRIVGAGVGKTVIKNCAGNIGSIGIFNGTNVSNVEIAHLTIDGNRRGDASNNKTKGIYIAGTGNGSGASRLWFQNLHIINTFSQGILVGDAVQVFASHIVVEKTVHVDTGDGIQFNDCQNCSITDSVAKSTARHGFSLAGTSPGSTNSGIFNSFVSSPTNQAIDLENCDECIVEGNTFTGGGQIKVTNTYTRIIANYIENPDRYGIRILDSNALISNNVIRAPKFKAGEGVCIYVTGSGVNSIIDGNRCESADRDTGIRSEADRTIITNNIINDAGQNGISSSGHDVLINGNLIENANADGAGEAAILVAAGQRVQVNNNVIRSTAATPTTRAGILFRSSANNFSIVGNAIDNTKGPGIQIVDVGGGQITANTVTNTGKGAAGSSNAGILVKAAAAGITGLAIQGNYVSNLGTGIRKNALAFDAGAAFTIAATVQANTFEGGVLETGTGKKSITNLAAAADSGAKSKTPGINPLTLDTDDTNKRVSIGTQKSVSLLTLGDTDSFISTDSADGADTKRIVVQGGGGRGRTRGAQVSIFGNEYPGNAGLLELAAGDGGSINFFTSTGDRQGQRLIITKDGNVGIGVANPAQKLEVAGNGLCTGSSSCWQNVSDRALKSNIRALEYGMKEIMEMKPIRFDWTSGLANDIGFIAQDIEGIVPEVVMGEEGGKSIGYTGLVPVLVNALKEQQTQIEALKKRIEDLEHR